MPVGEERLITDLNKLPRKGAVLGLLVGLLAAASPAAGAARPDPEVPETLASDHFVVHYTTDQSSIDASSAQTAQNVATYAEQAYALETGQFQFPPPPSDGDGKTDIYIKFQIGSSGSEIGAAVRDDTSADQTTGWIEIRPTNAGSDRAPGTIAHELIHILQYGLASHEAYALLEGTAEWAAARTIGHSDFVGYIVQSGDSLDCSTCSHAGYDIWPFFESLARDYGDGIVHDIFEQAHLLAGDHQSHMLQAIDQALVAHGSGLGQAFLSYARRNLTGDYPSSLEISGAPARPQSALNVGSSGTVLPDRETWPSDTETVDHLAAHYVAFRPADGQLDCPPATLHLSVALPAGIGSAPAFWRSAGQPAVQALAVTGDTGTLDVPWNPCTTTGLLVLPNPGSSADGQVFTLSASLTKDKASPSPGVDPGTDPPAIAPIPRLSLHLPAVLKVSRRSRQLKLAVNASSRGRVVLKLHSRTITHTFSLRAGPNVLALKLPKWLRAGRHRLTLTPRSSSGRSGRAVSRTIKIVYV